MLGFGDPIEWLRQLAIWLPIFIVSVTVHEFAHAFVADRLGDPTPRSQGRVTLNPASHVDPMGTLALVFVHFGWGRPVQIQPQNFKNPRLGDLLTSLAGPLSNLLLAVGGLMVLKYAPITEWPLGAQQWVFLFFRINLILTVFNLLPIPPLDGGHIIQALLPRRWLPTFRHLQPYGMILVLVLVFMPGLNVMGMLFDSVMGLMLHLV